MSKDYVKLLDSASRTTTQTGTLELGDQKGCVFVLDMTTVGTGSVTLSINGYDVASTKAWTILAGAAVVTNSTNIYRVYPGLTAVANSVASDILPKTIQWVVTANNANAAVYSLTASFID